MLLAFKQVQKPFLSIKMLGPNSQPQWPTKIDIFSKLRWFPTKLNICCKKFQTLKTFRFHCAMLSNVLHRHIVACSKYTGMIVQAILLQVMQSKMHLLLARQSQALVKGNLSFPGNTRLPPLASGGVHKLRWPFLTTYLPLVDIGEGTLQNLRQLFTSVYSFTVKRENLHIVIISSTTYLPHFVNVICERPLVQPKLCRLLIPHRSSPMPLVCLKIDVPGLLHYGPIIQYIFQF